MAAEGELQKETATHKKGYDGFISLMKWGTALSFIVAILVIFIIAE